MKRIFIFLALVCLGKVSGLYSQTNKADTMKYFMVLYTVGEAWDTTKQYYEQKYFDDHSKFLGKLRKEKWAVIGARYSDTGMVIIKASDEKTAYLIMEGDVSVRNKLFKFELYEMDVFYEGCIE